MEGLRHYTPSTQTSILPKPSAAAVPPTRTAWTQWNSFSALLPFPQTDRMAEEIHRLVCHAVLHGFEVGPKRIAPDAAAKLHKLLERFLFSLSLGISACLRSWNFGMLAGCVRRLTNCASKTSAFCWTQNATTS